jgi:hypothetical protein
MSKLNCQNAVYWAATQANQSQANDFLMFQKYPPYYPGPWNQSVCANATYDGDVNGMDNKYDIQPGITFMSAICGQNILISSNWPKPKNYYNKSANNYIDPSTLCDLPVAVKFKETSLVYFSTACYCTR